VAGASLAWTVTEGAWNSFVSNVGSVDAGMLDVLSGACCASIDGDADRVVFFTKG
jgi:hypothetical protein